VGHNKKTSCEFNTQTKKYLIMKKKSEKRKGALHQTGKCMYYAVYLFLAGLSVLFGCNKNDNAEPPVLAHPEGTAWKLAGIVDAQTGILKELEPKNCEKCYTIKLLPDNMASGYSVVNEIMFCFSQTCLSKKDIVVFMTKFGDGDIGDVRLFYDALLSVDSYSYGIEKDELMFFYNNKQNYLLYKLIQQ
jgi:hypothetical protein